MPSESYQKTAVILLISFIIHFAIITWFETTPLLQSWDKVVTKFVWGASDWVVYVPCIVYFVMVMWHLYIRSPEAKKAASKTGGPGTLTNNLLIAWNFLLAAFSMIIFAGFIRSIYKAVRTHGAYAWICDGSINWRGEETIRLYSFIFLLSKLPELLDTVFLVIRGKPVLFLHWYHHISVLLYCWLVARSEYPGTFFAIVNAFVHSIMYYYYFRMAQGIRPKFAKIITQIQLTQMALGMAETAVFYYFHKQDPSCDGGKGIRERGLLYTNYAATGGMYLSYFVLFALFYIERYCNPKKGEATHEE